MSEAVRPSVEAEARRQQLRRLRAEIAAGACDRRRSRIRLRSVVATVVALIAGISWYFFEPLLGASAANEAVAGKAMTLATSVIAFVLVRMAHATRAEVDDARMFARERQLAEVEE